MSLLADHIAERYRQADQILTSRERHYLTLLKPDGATISVGTSVGYGLYRRGLVKIAKFGRLRHDSSGNRSAQ